MPRSLMGMITEGKYYKVETKWVPKFLDLRIDIQWMHPQMKAQRNKDMYQISK